MADRTLLITGASSGIGAATARAAAAAGWKVALAARSADKLDALVREIGRERALALTCNVARQEDVAGAVEAAAEFGPLHAVFANAGLGATVPGAEGGEVENWRQMIDVNVWGLCLTVKAALPYLRETRGHLLLTGSQAGRSQIKGSVYGATKWFVHGFGQNLAQEMAEWGGRCTVIAPGLVDTPFFDEPKPQGLTAEAVARAAIYALEQPPEVNVREVFLTPLD
ncbi:short-chain dehydrogenase [Phormidium willei BDU 130791]|nr:short-chain dehydrogenase [Phormidium willei BDU 130791]